MSLRLRLALVMVGLAAAGLLITDVVTYSALRSFLTVRVDQQLEQAVGAVWRALEGGFAPDGTNDVPLPDRPPSDPGPEPPPGSPALTLPPGTYGEVIDANGEVVRRVQFDYGDTSLPVPDIPSVLPDEASGSGDATLFTVPAAEGASGQFRVMAVPLTSGSGHLVIAIPLTEMSQTLHRLLLVMLFVTAIVLGCLAVLSWLVVRRDLRPLDRMGVAAEAIAAGDLSRRVEVADSRNEVGRLGLAFNKMIAQIEQAFRERVASEERLRRFLADASHELRTPITSIRGYAELFRRGASARPDDLATSMRRIEQEAARMGILVEDMLVLARMDQARPLRMAPVDLVALANDAAHDARALDPSREVTVSTPDGLEVVGDEDRLRQVFSNLLANALRHTPPGTPVDASVRREADHAVIEVADRGPGLSDEQAARAFEPFYRSDEGRSRDKGGTGLGLSIVAAIAEAHSGAAGFEAREGGGSVFTVSFPMAPPSVGV